MKGILLHPAVGANYVDIRHCKITVHHHELTAWNTKLWKLSYASLYPSLFHYTANCHLRQLVMTHLPPPQHLLMRDRSFFKRCSKRDVQVGIPAKHRDSQELSTDLQPRGRIPSRMWTLPRRNSEGLIASRRPVIRTHETWAYLRRIMFGSSLSCVKFLTNKVL